MTKPVRFDPEAEEELFAAVSWYQGHRPGLGVELMDAVQEAMRRITQTPASLGLAPGVSTSLGVRRCPLQRFPYSLVFLELSEEIRVLAVAHHRRRPGYWRSRL
jgi:toxin ParE1/3/4